MIDITIEAFAALVEEVWAKLPGEWIEQLKEANISYEIVDLAPRELAESVGSEPWGLLGLYKGVPRMARRGFEPIAMPDRITIFRLPIMARVVDFQHLKEMISHVLYHEIGHHFGLSEDELRRAQKPI